MELPEKKVLIPVILIAFLLVFAGGFLLYQHFFKTSYEAELFSIMPSEGMSGAAYMEITKEGASELVPVFGFNGWNTQNVDGASIAVGEYGSGTRIWAMFIRTGMKPESAAAAIGELLGGVETESLKAGGKDLTLVYMKSDTEKKNPVCLWKRDDGIGAFAIDSNSQVNTLCRFASEFSCRGQLFEAGLLRIKIKGAGENRMVVTDASCGGASLSSKNLRYVQIPDTVIDKGNEVWLDEIPCYDAGNTLAKGSTFTGKVFLKYYLENEGPGSPRLIAGDVVASSGSEKLSRKRCVDLLEESYDPSVAVSLLSGAIRPDSLFPYQGDKLGTVKIANGLGKAVAAAFSRQEADYLLISGNGQIVSYLSGVKNAGNLKCFTNNESVADLIDKSGKLACRRVSEGLLKGLAYERINESGDAFIVIASQKYPSDRIERTASELAFGAPIGGKDTEWVNETKGTVLVYFMNRTKASANTSQEPLDGARVELYFIPSGSDGSMGALLEVAETDSSGKAQLSHVPLNGGLLIVSKRGFASVDGRNKLVQAPLSPDDGFSASVLLGPELSESEALEDYMYGSGETSLASGPIEARGTFPSLSAFGITLVNSTGSVVSLVAVGNKAPPEEVVLAARIARTLSSREYNCDVMIKAGGQRVEPYKNPPQLLTLDSARPEGTIIAVGNPGTNAILREAVGLNNDGESASFIETKGSIIAVVGSGKDAMKSAKEFVSKINYTVLGCGGNSYFGKTKLIDATGKPVVRVVIGAQASTEEALAGAYLATTIASMSAMCVRAEKEELGCISMAKDNPEQLVVPEYAVIPGQSLVSIGGPIINSLSNRNCSACASLYSGQAVISTISNDIYISGFRMDNTLYAGSEFSSMLENPMPPFQQAPYYAIKVSGFIQKENGHHELVLSFYDSVKEIQTGKAAQGEFYLMNGGGIAKVNAVSARSVGSASVTFGFDGLLIPVEMGRFLCWKGNVEDSLNYCTSERKNTTLSIEVNPSPALFMGKLEVKVEYKDNASEILGSNCSYCISGPASLCRPLLYKSNREHWYYDEFILQGFPIGSYAMEANCTMEGYKNGTRRVGFNITRVQLPDLIVDGLWINSISNTKVTATARIKNIGEVAFNASDATPLVTCLWDGYGRNLFSHINYTASLKPGESLDFTQQFFLASVEGNNTLLAKADCNNVYPEEREDNNEKSINFGRYG